MNQRGQTSYTAGGVYTLDRWMSSTTTKTIKILDDHLSIVDTADYGAFLQRFEYKGLLGRTVTLSVLAKRTAQGAQNPYITVMIGNNKFEGYGEIVQSDDYQLSSCTVTLSATAPSEGYFFVDIVGMTGSSIEIKAAKLELGDTQTLAHKENGVWVLNEIPDFGEQLRRCQRYCRPIPHKLDICVVGETYYAYTEESFEEMRVAPVSLTNLVGKNVKNITDNDAATIINVFTWNKYGGVAIQLSQNPNTDIVFLDSMNYLISADL